ncbi:hypothetical protein [Streptomyces wedmorensis]
MQSVMKLRDERQARLNKHPFFDWLARDTVPLEDRLTFLPILANFSMGFRDVNKWVLRYPNASDELRQAINAHTFEDQTHSRLYLEDWEKLGLDGRLGWSASDTLWWLFLADANEAARKHGIYFLSMGVTDQADPLLRFAHSEVIEACGNVFFEHVVHIAQALGDRTGEDYRYLGPFHLARETGHVDTEGAFEDTILDDHQRERALDLANTMFDLFEEMFDRFLAYAETYVTTRTVPRPDARPIAAVSASPQAHGARPRLGGPVHLSQTPIQNRLHQRKAQTACHPFYQWLHNRREVTAKQALQRFLPMWAMDIMGYRDLNHYAMRYPHPTLAREHAVNRWVDDLTTHNTLYLADWQQLDLDRLLGWSASDTLRFCFLDPQMDVHRRNIVKFTTLAAANPDPVLRLWLMHALESSGDAFFHNTRQLALQAEADNPGLRLDYLADRHDIAHRPHLADPRIEPVSFKDLPLGDDDCQGAIDMIDTVFDSVDEQLDISLDVALGNTFNIP